MRAADARRCREKNTEKSVSVSQEGEVDKSGKSEEIRKVEFFKVECFLVFGFEEENAIFFEKRKRRTFYENKTSFSSDFLFSVGVRACNGAWENTTNSLGAHFVLNC